jgi:hypothetical protein
VPTEAIVADEDVDDCEVDERVDREDMVQEGSARILPQDIVCYGQFVKVGPPTICATPHAMSSTTCAADFPPPFHFND